MRGIGYCPSLLLEKYIPAVRATARTDEHTHNVRHDPEEISPASDKTCDGPVMARPAGNDSVRINIDHIFKDLFPAQGMTERSEQIKLSHRMLDAMLNGGIALCDAGTGIGKTYAYLTAAMNMDMVMKETIKQFRAYECPGHSAYAPSAEVIRLNNAIDRGLEQPDSPESVMVLILQGAAARYDCCPQPISEYEDSDRPVEVDWRRFRRVVSYITVAPDASVKLAFADDNLTGKDK
mgnify:CR=1 FL=1